MTKLDGQTKTELCPNCESEITEQNPIVPEHYVSGGVCLYCYDPTPYYPDLG